MQKWNSGVLDLISTAEEKQAALSQLVIESSSVFCKKFVIQAFFLIVVAILLIVTQKALYSPWGRNDESNKR